MSVGIDVSRRVIILHQLQAELEEAGVSLPHGLIMAGERQVDSADVPENIVMYPPQPDGALLFTQDDFGNPIDLPPEAEPIVAAYTPEIAT